MIRIVGIALVTTYVAVGMVVGPIGHIRGFPDPKVELAEVRIRRAGIGIEISTIQQNRLVRNNISLTCNVLCLALLTDLH